MWDELLSRYRQEREWVRARGREFAARSAGAAAGLANPSTDPHVERLLDGFAMLAARTRQRVEDDFPQLAEFLLDRVAPFLRAPVPAQGVVQITAAAGAAAAVRIEAGERLTTDWGHDQPRCSFRLARGAEVWPVRVADARWVRGMYPPTSTAAAAAAGAVRLLLETAPGAPAFNQLHPDRLEFHIGGGDLPARLALFALLVRHASAVELALPGAGASAADRVTATSTGGLRVTGLEGEVERPAPGGDVPQALTADLLVRRMYALPESLLFVEAAGLPPQGYRSAGGQMALWVHFRELPPEPPNLTADTFRLGCAPVVNLFVTDATPVTVSAKQAQHPVRFRQEVDNAPVEVLRVRSVALTAADDGTQSRLDPLYGRGDVRPGAPLADAPLGGYWQAVRVPGERPEVGAELDLLLTTTAESVDGHTLHVEVEGFNGDLPYEQARKAGAAPPLRWAEPRGEGVTWLTGPTRTLRPDPKRPVWEFVQLFSLSHLSPGDPSASAAGLRRLLELLDLRADPDDVWLRSQLLRLTIGPSVARVPALYGVGFVRGVELRAEFDAKADPGRVHLLGCVLDRFLARTCGLNSFTRLTIGPPGGELRWPPRAGARELL